MITIQAQLSKKTPIEGVQFSSQQASITISAEVNDINHVVSEAARLYALAEQAVDAQLAGNSAPVKAPVVQSHMISSLPSPSPSQQPAASRPYRGGGQRRQGSPCSPAQARYLRQLGERAPQALSQALADQGVDSIESLSARGASTIIDHLVQATA